jgi:hypothetical protein
VVSHPPLPFPLVNGLQELSWLLVKSRDTVGPNVNGTAI